MLLCSGWRVRPSADWRSEFNAGNAAFNKGDLDTAIAHFTKSIELKPGLAEAHKNRGIAFRGKQLYDQAIADYTKAIELKPDLANSTTTAASRIPARSYTTGESYLKKV